MDRIELTNTSTGATYIHPFRSSFNVNWGQTIFWLQSISTFNARVVTSDVDGADFDGGQPPCSYA